MFVLRMTKTWAKCRLLGNFLPPASLLPRNEWMVNASCWTYSLPSYYFVSVEVFFSLQVVISEIGESLFLTFPRPNGDFTWKSEPSLPPALSESGWGALGWPGLQHAWIFSKQVHHGWGRWFSLSGAFVWLEIDILFEDGVQLWLTECDKPRKAGMLLWPPKYVRFLYILVKSEGWKKCVRTWKFLEITRWKAPFGVGP